MRANSQERVAEVGCTCENDIVNVFRQCVFAKYLKISMSEQMLKLTITLVAG